MICVRRQKLRHKLALLNGADSQIVTNSFMYNSCNTDTNTVFRSRADCQETNGHFLLVYTKPLDYTCDYFKTFSNTGPDWDAKGDEICQYRDNWECHGAVPSVSLCHCVSPLLTWEGKVLETCSVCRQLSWDVIPETLLVTRLRLLFLLQTGKALDLYEAVMSDWKDFLWNGILFIWFSAL